MNSDNKIFATAKKCSQLASKMCLEFKHGVDSQTLKKDKTWVTEADKNIEAELRKIIFENHPDHSILGEEQGGSVNCEKDAYTWILDPIDGTFSFVHNIPFYSSLIAVLKEGKPIIGFAALPALNITMSAMKGSGVFINDEPYSRNKLVGNPLIELIATADPYRFYLENKGEFIQELYSDNYKTRTYPDALGYYLLLNGSIKAFIDPKVEIWDVAPFHVILPEAGFAIHNWEGNAILQKGNSIAYPIDTQNLPINCSNIVELAKRFA
ncbi:inositol monophosphatase [Pigmentibacter sp. JX0631]|uniref:inositol monophosphatase family protein n=1 Tax=Pigmentibacter sp. JX0631 TaxID=2976982 RepID=UPI002468A13E|nr:inositol monophosphatase [Pigmentibacter sp. JX0631]WGL58616.1 inositol monophosphatase [Pigmentibacter sp. JX0631]